MSAIGDEHQDLELAELGRGRAELVLAVVHEAVGLVAVAVLLISADPRVQLWLKAAAARARSRLGGRGPDHAADRAVAELSADITAYEHARRGTGGCTSCGD